MGRSSGWRAFLLTPVILSAFLLSCGAAPEGGPSASSAGAGRSIAVQNFNENISIFAMLGLYAVMEKMELHIFIILTVFGLILSGVMSLLYKKHRHDQDSGAM